MDIDEALCHLGKHSKWHILSFIAIGSVFLVPQALQFISIVFIGYKPPFQCKNNLFFANQSHTNGSCLVYSKDQLVPCQNGWEFPNFTGSTIATEWQLVCDKEGMVSTNQTVFVAGFIIGILILSFLADKFGRRTICLYSLLGMAVISSFSCLSPTFNVFTVSRFCVGILDGGLLVTGFTFINEIFPMHQRAFGGILMMIFWSIAMCLLSMLAYFIENWRYLMLSLSLYCFMVLPLFCFIRESFIWDISKGRIDHAEETLRIAAKINRITFTEPILKRFEVLTIESVPIEQKENTIGKSEIRNDKKIFHNVSAKDGIVDLIRNKVMLIYLIISIALWFGMTLIYYSLLLSSAAMHGNRFLNMFLGAIAEIPIYFLTYLVSNRFGRKKPLQAQLLSSALLFLLAIYFEVKKDGFPQIAFYVTMAVTIFCKVTLSSSATIYFLYSNEIFPTTIRATASGVSAMFGRMATFFSVYSVKYMQETLWICFLVYGIVLLFLFLLVFYLPETHHIKLASTIEEACNMRKKPRTSCEKKTFQGGLLN